MSPMSSLGSAVLQSGALLIGLGLGAGVGGLAGADGNVLPGMTLGFEGIGIGIDDPLDMDEPGVLTGRDRPCASLILPRLE